LFCFVMLVLVLFACCAAASVCGYRRQLHGFICWLWRRWRT
jgi:nitrate reductase NapE component